jgi:Tfp pilus assembly protein PilF
MLSSASRALLLTAALATCGCGRSQASNTAQNLKTFQQEQAPEKLLERGRAFARMGDLTRAEEYLGAALERGAEPQSVMPLLLMVCVQDGRMQLAIQYASDHLRRHPTDAQTRLVLGTLYAGLGENQRAETELRQVLATKPNEGQAHYALAVILRDRGDALGAEEHFREYVRISPRGPYAEEARASLTRNVQ